MFILIESERTSSFLAQIYTNSRTTSLGIFCYYVDSESNKPSKNAKPAEIRRPSGSQTGARPWLPAGSRGRNAQTSALPGRWAQSVVAFCKVKRPWGWAEISGSHDGFTKFLWISWWFLLLDIRDLNHSWIVCHPIYSSFRFRGDIQLPCTTRASLRETSVRRRTCYF